ncbi:Clavaminate synthase-like protein [Guyanagaster necrorhizus]|uniref:Clavaminate synthase-like protein n=1 Tax=Guyanagaster necrorhizus TaxID=856835 RepID=A0A9P8AYB7_9AGAR|nr:Clavaminate synthase-like protein [Guyanagaster necrorhizus MCA 3950]KAG7452315.1 Clavaminate synthase-like protein [Guyanagaster necrorhizus MCA 3950]
MDLPIIDLDLFLSQSRDTEVVVEECKKVANALIVHGALLLRDSRVSEEDNITFLDLLEDYFAQSEDILKKDERPELSYQVGVTLELTEKPKCAVDTSCLRVIERLERSQRPVDISAHNSDPKCRFFWKMGVTPPPYQTQFPCLNAPNVVPQAEHIKERWLPTMEKWGMSMKRAVENLADMASIGLGLRAETFREAGRYGPHILAPTASDLVKYGEQNTILAGFHTDLNFLTIHGRSRYPGLHIWARNTGRRIAVQIPEGNYLLVQAGKQLEHISGGLIKAGYHEVVVNDKTIAVCILFNYYMLSITLTRVLEVIEQRKREHPSRPLIRISSTFFWHLSSDYDLEPIPTLAEHSRAIRAAYISLGKDNGEDTVYEPMKVGQQVQNELKDIALMA